MNILLYPNSFLNCFILIESGFDFLVTYRPKQRRLPSKSPIRKGRAPLLPLLSHEPLGHDKGETTSTGISRGEMTLSAPATLEIPREPTLEGVLQISPKPLTKSIQCFHSKHGLLGNAGVLGICFKCIPHIHMYNIYCIFVSDQFFSIIGKH